MILISAGLFWRISSLLSANNAAADGKLGRILGIRPAGIKLFLHLIKNFLNFFSPENTSVGKISLPKKSSECAVKPAQLALLKLMCVLKSASTNSMLRSIVMVIGR